MRNEPIRNLMLIMLGGGIALTIIAVAFANDIVSPGQFGFFAIGVIGLIGVGIWMQFNKATTSALGLPRDFVAEDQVIGRRKATGTIWLFRLIILFLLYSLVRGLVETTGSPIWQRIVPAAINLMIVSAFVIVLVRLQNRKD